MSPPLLLRMKGGMGLAGPVRHIVVPAYVGLFCSLLGLFIGATHCGACA